MSLSEERRMVLEMLSEGKIEVEDAQGLLEALGESRQRPIAASQDGCCGLGLDDLTIELDEKFDFLDEAFEDLGEDFASFANWVG
jgi:hypothetical protein